jgi:hypothetical protein
MLNLHGLNGARMILKLYRVGTLNLKLSTRASEVDPASTSQLPAIVRCSPRPVPV